MFQNLRLRLADLLLPRRRAASDLDRALSAARSAHIAARRGLAIALAEEDRETTRRESMIGEARGLETRAVDALRGGREDLASRAAEAIAVLETEVAASRAASKRFADNVAATRREADAQRRRLADLDRGRRLAIVGAALNGTALASERPDPITRAEDALARVEADNAEAAAVRAAFAPPNAAITDDLAEAGFGPRTRVLTADVMLRLQNLAHPALAAGNA